MASDNPKHTIRIPDTRETLHSTRMSDKPTDPPPHKPGSYRQSGATTTDRYDSAGTNVMLGFIKGHEAKHDILDRAAETLRDRVQALETEVEALKEADDRGSAHDLNAAADAARLDMRLKTLESIPGLIRAQTETTQKTLTKNQSTEWVKVVATFVGVALATYLATAQKSSTVVLPIQTTSPTEQVK